MYFNDYICVFNDFLSVDRKIYLLSYYVLLSNFKVFLIIIKGTFLLLTYG